MHRSEPAISFRNIGSSGARRGEEGYTGVSGKDNSALEALQETRWGEDISDNALFRLLIQAAQYVVSQKQLGPGVQSAGKRLSRVSMRRKHTTQSHSQFFDAGRRSISSPRGR